MKLWWRMYDLPKAKSKSRHELAENSKWNDKQYCRVLNTEHSRSSWLLSYVYIGRLNGTISFLHFNASICLPIDGTFNACVFFRRKYLLWRRFYSNWINLKRTQQFKFEIEFAFQTMKKPAEKCEWDFPQMFWILSLRVYQRNSSSFSHFIH